MFGKTEVDKEVLGLLKDAKSQDKYLLEIMLLKVIERATWAILCSTLGIAFAELFTAI